MIILASMIMAGMIVLLTPSIWTDTITGYLSDYYAADGEWQIEFESMTGHLLTTTEITNLRISNRDSTQLLIAPLVELNINPMPWLVGKYSFRSVSVNDFELSIFTGEKSDRDSVNSISGAADISIKELSLSGIISAPGMKELEEVSILYDGRLRIRRHSSFIFINELTLQDAANHMLAVHKSGLQVFPDSFIIRDMEGSLDDQSFTINIEGTLKPQLELNGKINCPGLELLPDSTSRRLFNPDWQLADIDLEFSTDLASLTGQVQLSANKNQLLAGFDLAREDGVYLVNKLEISTADGRIIGQGLYESDGIIRGRLNLTEFDLEPILHSAPRTSLSGLILFEGHDGSKELPEVWLSLELAEESIVPGMTNHLSGSFILNDSTIRTDNPLSVGYDSGLITSNGWLNYKSRMVNLSSDFSNLDITGLSDKLPGLKAGVMTGDVRISGNIEAPVIDGVVTVDNLAWHDLLVDQMKTDVHLSGDLNHHAGNVIIDIRNAAWRQYRTQEGFAELSIEDRIIGISSLNFKDGDNFLQLSGVLNPQASIELDMLRLGYGLHYFVNATPVKLNWSENDYRVKPFTLHVDDGILNGFLTMGEYREGRLKFSNFNSDAILEHFPKGLLGLSGIVFGEISLMGDKGDESFDVELSIKNGSILNQDFDDLIVSAVFLDSVFHFDEFTLTDGEKVGIQFSGIIPFDRQRKGTVPIELMAELRQVDFGFIRQFIPNFIFMDGKISGELNLSGTTKNTRLSYDLGINNAVFDRIPLGQVNGYGSFQNYRMDLGYFESLKGNNAIRGSGSLPIDFNIASKNFGQWIFGDSLDLNVTAKTGDMEFLTSYLDDVDSLTGDFDIGLFLSGVPERIVRDGWIRVDDGSVYTILLDNTIDKVSGDLRLTNNRMEIQRLVGTATPSAEFNRRLSLRAALTGQRSTSQSNLSLSGSMDMAKFFRPRFDLGIQAEEAYIRTLLGDIEGLVDVDLTMVGKDTITFSGTIAPINVEMKQEFTSEEVDKSDLEPGRITTVYKLTFPIEEEFKLINSQLDADLTGELSLIKYGRQDSDFSGELYISSGRFYYTGVIFSIQSDGSLLFDGKGFNPDMDIQAVTNISEYEITASLVGQLDNPTLTFEESTSTLSQSDILALLTLKTHIGDNTTASQGFGQVSGSLFNAWFEQQLEKNLLQITRQLGIIDEVNIVTTSELNEENPDAESDNVTTITAQRQLSDKLALNYSYSYKRSFGFGNPNQQLVGVEYKLNRYLSLVGNYDDQGNLQVKYRLRFSY